MLDERMPPYDGEAEKSVCGSLLIDGDTIFTVAGKLNAEDFFTEQNKTVYKACLAVFERHEGINQITVAHQLANEEKLEGIGGVAYLSHLIAEVPTSLHIEFYAEIVSRTAVQRKYITLASQISNLGYNEPDVDKLASEVNSKVVAIQQHTAVSKVLTPQELTKAAIDRYSELREGKRRGVYTGFKELDELTGGLFGGEICYIGARPKHGKSQLLLSISRYIGRHFGNVLLASLEQPYGDVLDRWVSSNLSMSPRLLRVGNYPEERFDSIIKTVNEDVLTSNVFFYHAGNTAPTTASIFTTASYLQMRYGLSAIIIDQISNLRDDIRGGLYEKTTEVSHRIKGGGTAIDIPVFCAVQINREPEHRESHKPGTSDLRDSGYLEADADIVLLLHRPDLYEEDIAEKQKLQGTAEVIIGACRQNGEAIGISVPLLWDKQKRYYYDRYMTKDKESLASVSEQFK